MRLNGIQVIAVNGKKDKLKTLMHLMLCSLSSPRASFGYSDQQSFTGERITSDLCPEFELPIRFVHLGSSLGASEELNE